MNGAAGSGPDLRANVLTSPGYWQECEALFEFFRATRHAAHDPKTFLALQAALGLILVEYQAHLRESRAEGNPVREAAYKRLRHVLKRIVDGMAWRALGFDRAAVHLVSQHNQTGAIDDSINNDFFVANKIVEEEGAFVVVNDLTNILRHGDLTIVTPGSVQLQENKSGKASRRNRRAIAQKAEISSLIGFLTQGERISGNGLEQICRLRTAFVTFHREIETLLRRATESSTGEARLELPGVVFDAVSAGAPACSEPWKNPFGEECRSIRITSVDAFERGGIKFAPASILPFDDRLAFDLLTGKTMVSACIDVSHLQAQAEKIGCRLNLPDPTQDEMLEYVKADAKRRKELLRLGLFTLSKGSANLSFTPDVFVQVALEFVVPTTVLRGLGEALRYSECRPEQEPPGRLYLGYEGERAVWK